VCNIVTEIPSHIRAVFFDVVGTVLFPDPSASTIYSEIARRSGLNISEEEIRKKFVEAFNFQETIDRSAGWITSEERERERWRSIVVATVHGVADPEACFIQLFDHFAKPGSWRLAQDFKQVSEGLAERGMLVGLGSNYDCRLLSVLDGFPALAPLRERTVISSVVGYRKPAVDFFRTVIAQAACDPHEVLFVGDDLENDYLGAIAAGLEARLLDVHNRHNTPMRIQRLSELNR
jgi:putative hydrolase of the HAD superfamily